MPMPSALSRIGIGLLRTKTSVRSRAAPAFSLVCSHALLGVPDIPRLLVWKAPTSADALVGISSLNSSPVGLIIQKDFVFRRQFARPPRWLQTLDGLSCQNESSPRLPDLLPARL